MKITSPCSSPVSGISLATIVIPYIVVGLLVLLMAGLVSAEETIKPAVPVSQPEKFLPMDISREVATLVFITPEGATVLRKTIVRVLLIPEEGVLVAPFVYGEKTALEPVLKTCKHFIVRSASDGKRIIQGVSADEKVVYERLLVPYAPPKKKKETEKSGPVYKA